MRRGYLEVKPELTDWPVFQGLFGSFMRFFTWFRIIDDSLASRTITTALARTRWILKDCKELIKSFQSVSHECVTRQRLEVLLPCKSLQNGVKARTGKGLLLFHDYVFCSLLIISYYIAFVNIKRKPAETGFRLAGCYGMTFCHE